MSSDNISIDNTSISNTSAIIITIESKPFRIFEYTNKTMNDCFYCMDTPTDNMSDAESSDVCCKGMCCLVFWPLHIVVDILSCPFRGCIHLKNRPK
jgi:hypothetical protein